MGLFDKIKQTFGSKKTPEVGQSIEDADRKVFELTKTLETISANRTKEVEKLRGVVRRAAELDRDSFEYKQCRIEAGRIKDQIKQYEEQFALASKLLQSNARYTQMLKNGQVIINLKALMPNPAEADFLISEMEKTKNEVIDDISSFSDIVEVHSQSAGVDPLAEYADSEFDAEVDRLIADAGKEKAAAEAPAAAAGVSVEAALDVSDIPELMDTDKEDNDNAVPESL